MSHRVDVHRRQRPEIHLNCPLKIELVEDPRRTLRGRVASRELQFGQAFPVIPGLLGPQARRHSEGTEGSESKYSVIP